MTNKGMLVLRLDSPVQATYARPDFDARGRWTTLTQDGNLVGTLWTDSDRGFGFMSAGDREIAKELNFYVQTSATASVPAEVAYGTALRIFPAQFGLSVEPASGLLGELFGGVQP
jgi:hypothetical protein